MSGTLLFSDRNLVYLLPDEIQGGPYDRFTLYYLRSADAIGWIIMNRSNLLNALNFYMLENLLGLLETICEDDDVRAVIITGTRDKAFSARADLTFLTVDTSPDQKACTAGHNCK